MDVQHRDNTLEHSRIGELRDMLYGSFPDVLYNGRIVPCGNDGPWPDELDEEEELVKVLQGKLWTEVPNEFIHQQVQGYVLLTPEAFAAYLPAWLLRSLENLGFANEVRDYLIYTFDPLRDSESSMKIRLSKLNSQQRETVYAFLQEFVKHEKSSFVLEHATSALVKFGNLENDK